MLEIGEAQVRSDYRNTEELRNFLARLESIGINPEALVSDGVPVYEIIQKKYGRISDISYVRFTLSAIAWKILFATMAVRENFGGKGLFLL
jgi:hypothetical protein